jgi:hypothetical protein
MSSKYEENINKESELKTKKFYLEQEINGLQCYVNQKLQEIVKDFYASIMQYNEDEKHSILYLILKHVEMNKILTYKYVKKLPNIVDNADPMLQFNFINIINIENYNDLINIYLKKCQDIIENKDEIIDYEKIMNTIFRLYTEYREIYNNFFNHYQFLFKKYHDNLDSPMKEKIKIESDLQNIEKKKLKMDTILTFGQNKDNKIIKKMYGKPKMTDIEDETTEKNKKDYSDIDIFYELYSQFIQINVYLFIIYFLENIQEDETFNKYIKLKKEFFAIDKDIRNVFKKTEGGKKSRRKRRARKRSFTKRR